MGRSSSFKVSWITRTLTSPVSCGCRGLNSRYSVHLSRVAFSSVMQFPLLPSMVLALVHLCLVNSFTTWYALLLLYFPKLSSVLYTLLLKPVFWTFLMFLLIFLLISLYSSPPVVFLSCFIFLRVSHMSKISSVTQGWVFRRCLPSISSAVSVISILKLLLIVSASSSRVSSGATFAPVERCLVGLRDGRVLKSVQAELEPGSLWLVDSFQPPFEVQNHKVMVTAYNSTWESPCLRSVDPISELVLYQSVVNLVMMDSVWCVPGLASRCFVFSNSVCEHHAIVTSKFQ